jgi:hypothetical protein
MCATVAAVELESRPMKLNLTAESLRALLVLEHTMNDLQDVLTLTLKVCRKHKTLAGVPALLDLLQRFEADLDKAHPCDRLLSGPIAANRAGAEDTIDLSADVAFDPHD